jgi:hypothetical protein
VPAPYAPVSFALSSPLGYPLEASRTNVAVALVYGDQHAVSGVAVGPAIRVRCASAGLLGSAAFSAIEGDARGAVFSTGINFTRGEARGVVGAPINISAGPVLGVQGGVVNIAAASVYGVQGGVVNVSDGVAGATLGVVNVSLGAETGGVQAGVVNFGRRVHGAQLGVVNVAEDADAAVGLISLSWARKIRPSAAASNVKLLQLGVTLDGSRVFTTLGGSKLAGNIASGQIAFGLELGVHLYRNDDEGFVWDAMLGADDVPWHKEQVGLGHWSTRVGYRLTQRVLPFAYVGNTFVWPVTDGATTRVLVEGGGGVIF